MLIIESVVRQLSEPKLATRDEKRPILSKNETEEKDIAREILLLDRSSGTWVRHCPKDSTKQGPQRPLVGPPCVKL